MRRTCVFTFLKQHLPILLGLVLGIACGLLITPPVEEDCVSSPALVEVPTHEATSANIDTEDYEPRINLAGKPQNAKREPKPLVRPRYYSTELAIREKVFVAALSSSNSIASLGHSLNFTLAHHINRLAFFMDISQGQKLDLIRNLPAVGFNDNEKGLLPLHTLKYLADNFVRAYNFFFLVRDNTYVNGRILSTILSHTSIAQDVYMGMPVEENGRIVCSIDAGIILSHSVIRLLADHLERCAVDAEAGRDDLNVGKCVLEAANLTCQPFIQEQRYWGAKLPPIELADIPGMWESKVELKRAVTIFPVKKPVVMYLLHQQACQSAIKDAEQQIHSLEEGILDMAELASDGKAGVTWPIGIPPPSKPASRFDVVRWDFFNETHIYLENDHSVVSELQGVYLKDVQDILSRTATYIEDKNPGSKIVKLVNGYRKFDATRGIDYIVDWLLLSSQTGKEVLKRVEACRPLTKVEVVPMPYVTENTRVNFILPVSESLTSVATAKEFMQRYHRACMSKGDNTHLFLALFYRSPQEPERFKELKDIASNYSQQYKKEGLRVSFQAYKVPFQDTPPSLMIADLVARKFAADSLLFVCDSSIEIFSDFLNRVRMNTISGWQVFNPIPYSEFNPQVSLRTSVKPTNLDISTHSGHYDQHRFDYISFYAADYLAVRKLSDIEFPVIRSERDLLATGSRAYPDIAAIFLKYGKVHVMRAVEPNLRMRYASSHCRDVPLTKRQMEHCEASRLESMGTRSQLAKLLFDYEKAKLSGQQ